MATSEQPAAAQCSRVACAPLSPALLLASQRAALRRWRRPCDCTSAHGAAGRCRGAAGAAAMAVAERRRRARLCPP